MNRRQAAEDAGLIHQLGQIVLGRSLDIVQTELLTGRWGGRRVSVNLSAMQLTHPDLPTRVLEALSSPCLPGEVLQLELTETRLAPDIATVGGRLGELRAAGVRLAIDDFGTGCANLSYLRDLPVDAIKIDGRFYAGVPLRAVAGYSYGTLCVIDVVPRVLTPDQREGLSRLARQVTVLLELRETVNR